jgi:hypothetical protein
MKLPRQGEREREREAVINKLTRKLTNKKGRILKNALFISQ